MMNYKIRIIVFTLWFVLLLNGCDQKGRNNSPQSNVASTDNSILTTSQKGNYGILFTLILSTSFLGIGVYLLFKNKAIIAEIQKIDKNGQSKTNANLTVKAFPENILDIDLERKIEDFLDKKIEEREPSIVEEVQKLIRLDMTEIIEEKLSSSGIQDKANYLEKEESTYKQDTENYTQKNSSVMEEYKLLYASSVNVDTHEFYSVTEIKDDETVYLFKIDPLNPEKAIFSVYSGASKKVIECPDFLEDACEVQHLGKTKLKTEKEGIAEKQSNNKWRISEKAFIIFE